MRCHLNKIKSKLNSTKQNKIQNHWINFSVVWHKANVYFRWRILFCLNDYAYFQRDYSHKGKNTEVFEKLKCRDKLSSMIYWFVQERELAISFFLMFWCDDSKINFQLWSTNTCLDAFSLSSTSCWSLELCRNPY